MRKMLTAAALTFFVLLPLCAPCAAAARGVLRVGTDADFQPYEYYQKESGAYTGFDVELIEALASLMGCGGVEFVTLPFGELFSALDDGRCDAAIAALIVTAERRARADFTAPYAEDRSVVLTAAGGGTGRNTAAEAGSVHMAYARGHFAEHGDVLAAESAEEAAGMVLSGEAARAVTSKLSAEYLIANVYGERLVIAAEDASAKPLAIAVRKGDAGLLRELNEALSRYMNSASYERLYRTYFGPDK